MAETLADHGHRLNHIDAGIAAIRRDQAADAEGVAHLEARIDRLQGQIDRINRRLDFTD